MTDFSTFTNRVMLARQGIYSPIVRERSMTDEQFVDACSDVREHIKALQAEVEQWHEAYNIAHDQAMANGEARLAAEAKAESYRKALEPFAREADDWNDKLDSEEIPAAATDIVIGDLRRARAALASTGGSDAQKRGDIAQNTLADGEAWQPIETAWTMEGTPIIVTDGQSVHGAGWWHPIEQAWLDCDGITPTHWMPLPEPPHRKESA